MLTSGVATRKEVNLDFDGARHGARHKIPFLDGKTIFTRKLEPINPIRDPTSDMAIFSKKGSALVKEKREQVERAKAPAKLASLGGTELGNIMSVKAEEAEADTLADAIAKSDEKEESTGDSKFASYLKASTGREYLPAFACREELLLKVIREKQCKLGSIVGYAICFEDYMTDGVLQRESLNEGDLDRYGVIILDEVLERSLSTDVLMGLLRKILSRRRDLRSIVTSATMNADKTSLPQDFSAFYGNAPCYIFPGRTFLVNTFHPKSPCDYGRQRCEGGSPIHLSLPPGDILLFVTRQEDIEITCQVINERLAQLDQPAPLAVLQIYSQMPADLQAKIFEATPDERTKVIVATNIATTSLTVDAGYSKLKLSQCQPADWPRRPYRQRVYPHSSRTVLTVPQLFIGSATKSSALIFANTVLLLKSLGVKNLV
ncbi:P-loop containing nucleoside triphosphate hydrolase protein [Suillus ampliporus]|nr:P-loop containing nucleoside triphosphate hydrolase protein [Suillus ampliporus]